MNTTDTRFSFIITETDARCFPKTTEFFLQGGRGKYRFMYRVMEKYLETLNKIPTTFKEYEVYGSALSEKDYENEKHKMHENSLNNLTKSQKRASVNKEPITPQKTDSDVSERKSKREVTIETVTNDFSKETGAGENLGDISKALGIDLSGFGL